MEHILKGIGDLAFFLCGCGAVFFCILYSIVAKWWKNKGGRFVFTFMAVVAIILVLGMSQLYFGPYPGIVFIRPAAYLSLASIIWWLISVMLVNQIKGYRQRNK